MNKNTILSPQRHDDTASNIQRQTCNQSPLWLISMIHNGINNRSNGDHRRIPDHSAKPLRSSASSVVNINEQHSLRSWLFCGSIVVHNLTNCGRCWWPSCEWLLFINRYLLRPSVFSVISVAGYFFATQKAEKSGGSTMTVATEGSEVTEKKRLSTTLSGLDLSAANSLLNSLVALVNSNVFISQYFFFTWFIFLESREVLIQFHATMEADL